MDILEFVTQLKEFKAILLQVCHVLQTTPDKVAARVKALQENWKLVGKLLKLDTANGSELILREVEALIELRDQLKSAAKTYGYPDVGTFADQLNHWISCPNCAERSLDNAKFCSHCGCKLGDDLQKWLRDMGPRSEPTIPQPSPTAPQPPPPPTQMPRIPALPTVAPRTTPAAAPVICPNCGAGNREGTRFCSHCGYDLSLPTPTPTPTPASVAPQKKSLFIH